MDFYIGPPDLILHDAGKQFLSNAFQRNARIFHITTKSVPVEAAQTMSLVERYHDLVRRAVRIIENECPDIDFPTALQIAVRVINDTAGPDGFVSTLLVFGALPRLVFNTDPPAPSIIQRAKAQQAAMMEIRKLNSRRQFRTALASLNGPDAPLDKQFSIG